MGIWKIDQDSKGGRGGPIRKLLTVIRQEAMVTKDQRGSSWNHEILDIFNVLAVFVDELGRIMDNAKVLAWVPRSTKLPFTKMGKTNIGADLEEWNQTFTLGHIEDSYDSPRWWAVGDPSPKFRGTGMP